MEIPLFGPSPLKLCSVAWLQGTWAHFAHSLGQLGTAVAVGLDILLSSGLTMNFSIPSLPTGLGFATGSRDEHCPHGSGTHEGMEMEWQPQAEVISHPWHRVNYELIALY